MHCKRSATTKILGWLQDADEEEVADILAAGESMVGVKKPTLEKFKRELAKLRGKGETFL